MLNELISEFNKTETQNGAITNKSSLNANVDFFGSIGGMRGKDKKSIVDLFMKAFFEDKELAMKNLFYARDIRGGLGERQIFRDITNYLAETYPSDLISVLKYTAEYGRWDDIIELLTCSNQEVKDEVLDLIASQLQFDLDSDNPSLLAKWMKSENASSEKTKMLARITAKGLSLSSREYRKILSLLRKRIGIVESLMSDKKWSAIEYDKLPSNAGMKYRQAFFRNDESRYKSFIDSLTKGETKINSGTLYPYQITKKVLQASLDKEEKALFDGMWNNLPDFSTGEESISVIDVSGSMFNGGNPAPIDVALSLGIYLADKNKGMYKNKFITFSSSPELVSIVGKDIYEKVNNVSTANWGMSTNIEAVFNILLKTAMNNNLDPKEMVKKIYIISDMEFDAVRGGRNTTLFHTMKKRFNENGYDLPNVIFWNVNSSGKNMPVRYDENNTALVSGFSPSIFNMVMENDLNPESFMLKVLNSDRYGLIKL